MKIKNFFMSLAAVALVAGFASCSSEEIVPGTTPVGPEPETPQELGNNGVAYMSFALNMPQSEATGRANDNFQDGEVYEFAVENATLVIFAGKTSEVGEDGLTLRSAYDLKSGQWDTDTNPQITRTRVITSKVLTANIDADEDAYAFIILNKHEFFKVENSQDDVQLSTLYQGAKELTGTAFSTFKKFELDEHNKNFNNQSFTMTNMPYVRATGGVAAPGTDAPWTLVKILKSHVYSTEAEAQEQAEEHKKYAAEIDVERVVAKVEVKTSATAPTTLQGNTSVKLGVLGWFVDNTNPTAYVVRNTAETGVAQGAEYNYLNYANAAATANLYRMASGAAVHTQDMGDDTTEKVVRTYWGVDPNYHVNNADGDLLVTEAGNYVDNRIMKFNTSGVLTEGRLREIGDHYYCAENTFDVKHQTVRNTTRAIIAVEFNRATEGEAYSGKDFFTLVSDPNTILTNDETPGQSSTLSSTVQNTVKDLLFERVQISNWIKDRIRDNVDGSKKDSQGKLLLTEFRKLFTVTVKPVTDKPGFGHVTLTPNAAALAALITDEGKREAAKEAWYAIETDQIDYIENNINNQLYYYKGGVAYYQVLIKHFGDVETPWTGTNEMTNETYSIYGNGIVDSENSNDYLGRYGVLRNNWYSIEVSGVRQIGSPIVPELTDIPDDNVEKYLAVKINIMPWVLRTQSGVVL